jgi:hypothetical protein
MALIALAVSMPAGIVAASAPALPDFRNELLVKFAADITEAQARESIRRVGAEVIGNPVLAGRLFHIRLRDAASAQSARVALEAVPGVEYVEPVQPVSILPR